MTNGNSVDSPCTTITPCALAASLRAAPRRSSPHDITGRGSIELWTKAKKMTTKWNKEAGVNWMS